eukprot:89765-Prymnesium_polylepis.2
MATAVKPLEKAPVGLYSRRRRPAVDRQCVGQRERKRRRAGCGAQIWADKRKHVSGSEETVRGGFFEVRNFRVPCDVRGSIRQGAIDAPPPVIAEAHPIETAAMRAAAVEAPHSVTILLARSTAKARMAGALRRATVGRDKAESACRLHGLETQHSAVRVLPGDRIFAPHRHLARTIDLHKCQRVDTEARRRGVEAARREEERLVGLPEPRVPPIGLVLHPVIDRVAAWQPRVV